MRRTAIIHYHFYILILPAAEIVSKYIGTISCNRFLNLQQPLSPSNDLELSSS